MTTKNHAALTPGMADLLSSRVMMLTAPYLRAIAAGTLAAAPETWAARGAARNAGDVAVIPIMGVLTLRGGWYGMSIEMIRRAYRHALDDAAVRAIVLEYDTPGGDVVGIDELATEFRQNRSVKPHVAIANGLSASAGYYLAAQAEQLLVTPSGEVGSIGCYGIHMDWSRALDEMGITVTLISAGEGKVDGNPYEPLSEEVKKQIQADIDRYYTMFVSAVSKGRNAEAATIKNEWQARMYGAKDAVKIGMADAVGTLDDALRRAASLAGERKTNAAAVDRDVELRTRQRSRSPV